MPLYDFQCNACNHEFEENVKLDEYEEDKYCVSCPECGACGPERKIVNPKHYKHLSWSTWRVGLGGD